MDGWTHDDSIYRTAMAVKTHTNYTDRFFFSKRMEKKNQLWFTFKTFVKMLCVRIWREQVWH